MKKFVEVIAKYNQEGQIRPLKIIWEDGRVFEIQRITDIRPAASLKAGGAGLRYSCIINKKKVYLFLEDNKWFIG
ncbi:MAG: hypothetical protein GX756_06130 [Clostridiales bacterium]|jgi:hypothetical protein|nr:hypothetical protein [Clostridiales bacterium]